MGPFSHILSHLVLRHTYLDQGNPQGSIVDASRLFKPSMVEREESWPHGCLVMERKVASRLLMGSGLTATDEGRSHGCLGCGEEAGFTAVINGWCNG
jgi:hypothetical protein